jgi:hypothetical protein
MRCSDVVMPSLPDFELNYIIPEGESTRDSTSAVRTGSRRTDVRAPQAGDGKADIAAGASHSAHRA